MLGYSKLTDDVHKKWCDDLEYNRKRYNRILLLKPRGTYKSSIYTISQVIELLMEDYVKNKQFTLRILIASSTDDLATQLLSEIVQHLQTNKDLREFFGRDIIAGANQQAVTLSPRVVHKEPNIKARGSGAAIVGEHYDVIIADDIVNQEDRESEAKRERNAKWFQDVMSIIEPDGYVMVTGTRWHLDDVYGHIIENNENDELEDEYKYHIEVEKAIGDNGKPNFPTILSESRLRALRVEKGVVEFASQYMNDPLSAGVQIFNADKMNFYTDYGTDSDLYKRCKTIAYLDPALGREGDFIVLTIGTILDGDLLVREGIMTNSTPIEEFLHVIENYHGIYDFSLLYIETNGFQGLIANACRELGLPVKDVGNRRKKEVRIEGVEPFFSSGKIKFREDWKKIYPDFIHQILSFPVAKHDDAPDALAGLAHAALFKQKNSSAYSKFVKNVEINKHSKQGHELNPRRRHRMLTRRI